MTIEDETFRFDFEATEDKRKAFPYVCKWVLAENGELEREFFDFYRDFDGRNDVTVSGEYEVRAGDVIEECVGGSWKNKYRGTYLVSPLGDRLPINGGKAEIRKYLKGKLSTEEFVSPSYRDHLAGGRQQRLECESERIEAEIQRLHGELEAVEAELSAENVSK